MAYFSKKKQLKGCGMVGLAPQIYTVHVRDGLSFGLSTLSEYYKRSSWCFIAGLPFKNLI